MSLKKILDSIPIPPLKECGEVLSDKFYRLKSYYHLLETSEPTNNPETTLNLINEKLIEIEDCHSGIEREENPGLTYNGRMYPIQEDRIERKTNGTIVAFSKGNKIIIENTGEFQIFSRKDDELILDIRYDN